MRRAGHYASVLSWLRCKHAGTRREMCGSTAYVKNINPENNLNEVDN